MISVIPAIFFGHGNPMNAVAQHALLPELSRFAVARSRWPSPLKSPTATEPAALPKGKLVAAPNLPVPAPKRIDTVLLPRIPQAVPDGSGL